MQGVRYELAAKPKSDLYLGLVAHVNAERVELPDLPELLRELRGLERRRGPSGRDRVDHRPGAHDDQANVVAGLADLLLARRRAIEPRIRSASDLPEGPLTTRDLAEAGVLLEVGRSRIQ